MWFPEFQYRDRFRLESPGSCRESAVCFCNWYSIPRSPTGACIDVDLRSTVHQGSHPGTLIALAIPSVA